LLNYLDFLSRPLWQFFFFCQSFSQKRHLLIHSKKYLDLLLQTLNEKIHHEETKHHLRIMICQILICFFYQHLNWRLPYLLTFQMLFRGHKPNFIHHYDMILDRPSKEELRNIQTNNKAIFTSNRLMKTAKSNISKI